MIETFNLPTVIEQAAEAYMYEANRRKIDFTLDLKNSPSEVIGDSKKIRSVVQNLTGNARKSRTRS